MVKKQRHAWYDFIQNSEHAGKGLPIILKKGKNRILILVKGANCSGDGFYSSIKKEKKLPMTNYEGFQFSKNISQELMNLQDSIGQLNNTMANLIRQC